MGLTLIQHGRRYALWSSNVDDVVTPAMGEAEMRILCANEGWEDHRIDTAFERANDSGISTSMYRSLEDLIRARIDMVENMNGDLEPGDEPETVPTREDLLAKWFVEDGHREGSVHPSDDGLDLIVRTSVRDGSGRRDVVLGLRDGDIAIVSDAAGGAQGLTIDGAAIDALINALVRLKPAIQQGEAVRREFLRIVDNDMRARIESDVDGAKGTFGMVDGAVVRMLGSGMTIPFEGGVDAILKIEDDGAYAVERAA